MVMDVGSFYISGDQTCKHNITNATMSKKIKLKKLKKLPEHLSQLFHIRPKNHVISCCFLFDVLSNFIVWLEFCFALILCDFNTTASNPLMFESWQRRGVAILNVQSFEFQGRDCSTISPLGNIHIKEQMWIKLSMKKDQLIWH